MNKFEASTLNQSPLEGQYIQGLNDLLKHVIQLELKSGFEGKISEINKHVGPNKVV